MEQEDTQETNLVLRNLLKSTYQTVERLEAENMKLRSQLEQLEQQVEHAEEAVRINKDIVRNNLENTNKLREDTAQEIGILREKVRSLGGTL